MAGDAEGLILGCLVGKRGCLVGKIGGNNEEKNLGRVVINLYLCGEKRNDGACLLFAEGGSLRSADK